MNALYNHFAQIKNLPHPATTSADDPQVFSSLQYVLFSIFYIRKILWFLVYLTILALIAVSLLLFTLICAAIV